MGDHEALEQRMVAALRQQAGQASVQLQHVAWTEQLATVAARELAGATALVCLDLSRGTQLSRAALRALGALASSCPRLRDLMLCGCELTGAELHGLADAWRQLKADKGPPRVLRVLLNNCAPLTQAAGLALMAEQVDGARVHVLARATGGLGSLEPLAQALEQPGTAAALTALDLSCNNLQARAFELLGTALRTNVSLTELGLSFNTPGAVGARALAAGLQHNRTLQVLDLSECALDTPGVQVLARALIRNPQSALRRLSVERNLCDDDAAAALLNAAVAVPTLAELMVEDTLVSCPMLNRLSLLGMLSPRERAIVRDAVALLCHGTAPAATIDTIARGLNDNRFARTSCALFPLRVARCLMICGADVHFAATECTSINLSTLVAPATPAAAAPRRPASLKMLCRRAIRESLGPDLLSRLFELPLGPSLRNYICYDHAIERCDTAGAAMGHIPPQFFDERVLAN
mgnify:CR=1 FL=1